MSKLEQLHKHRGGKLSEITLQELADNPNGFDRVRVTSHTTINGEEGRAAVAYTDYVFEKLNILWLSQKPVVLLQNNLRGKACMPIKNGTVHQCLIQEPGLTTAYFALTLADGSETILHAFRSADVTPAMPVSVNGQQSGKPA